MYEQSGPAIPAQVEEPDDIEPTEAAELKIFLMPVSFYEKRVRPRRVIARLRHGMHSARPGQAHR
jgi:hypothetical protein